MSPSSGTQARSLSDSPLARATTASMPRSKKTLPTVVPAATTCGEPSTVRRMSDMSRGYRGSRNGYRGADAESSWRDDACVDAQAQVALASQSAQDAGVLGDTRLGHRRHRAPLGPLVHLDDDRAEPQPLTDQVVEGREPAHPHVRPEPPHVPVRQLFRGQQVQVGLVDVGELPRRGIEVDRSVEPGGEEPVGVPAYGGRGGGRGPRDALPPRRPPRPPPPGVAAPP